MITIITNSQCVVQLQNLFAAIWKIDPLLKNLLLDGIGTHTCYLLQYITKLLTINKCFSVWESACSGHDCLCLKVTALETLLGLVFCCLDHCHVRILGAAHKFELFKGTVQLFPCANFQIVVIVLHKWWQASTYRNDFLQGSLIEAILDGVSVACTKGLPNNG